MASSSYLAQAVKAGVKVLCYKNGFNHSKLLVADDNVSSVGSANIDFRSFETILKPMPFLRRRNGTTHKKYILNR